WSIARPSGPASTPPVPRRRAPAGRSPRSRANWIRPARAAARRSASAREAGGSCAGAPDLLADLDLRRDQSEAAKTVGDLLLSAGEFVAHGEHQERRSVHAALYGVERHACPAREQA